MTPRQLIKKLSLKRYRRGKVYQDTRGFISVRVGYRFYLIGLTGAQCV